MASMGVMVSTLRASSFFRRASFSIDRMDTWSSAATVTVRTGDTLWALCRTYGLTMRQMLAYNPQIRDPDLIHTGEELRIG